MKFLERVRRTSLTVRPGLWTTAAAAGVKKVVNDSGALMIKATCLQLQSELLHMSGSPLERTQHRYSEGIRDAGRPTTALHEMGHAYEAAPDYRSQVVSMLKI